VTRLTTLLEETKLALDSVASAKWSEAQIAAQLNAQLVSMIRKMTETDQAYHAHVFTILATAARTIHTGKYAYRMPPWMMKLSEVRQYLGGSGVNVGPIIPRTSKWGGQGWVHTAINEIALVGWSQAMDLECYVSKIPARMTKGTLGAQSPATSSQLLLDPDGAAGDATNFPHESVADAYAGAVFEITGPAGTRKGQMLRCIASTPNQGVGTNQHLLTMESAWTSQPQTGDTYEMHAEIPGEHSRLLVLLVARALLSQQRNLEGVRIYQAELQEQWQQFLDAIKERDLQQPAVIQDPLPTMGVSPAMSSVMWEQ